MIVNVLLFQQLSGAFAVLLGIIAYAIYFHGIYSGQIKPHAFSWLIWAILTTIGFAAQVVDGGGPGAWVTGLTAAASFIFFAIGLRSSSRKLIVKSDWFFFVGSLIAIPPWYLTGNPLWSVVIITVIDAVAFIPTFRKAYAHPETESVPVTFLQGTKFIFGIFALQHFSIITVLYPLSLVIMNGAFVIMLLDRNNSSGKERSHS